MVDLEKDKSLSTPSLPFGGIVGQYELKEALLSVAAHPELSGLLIEGEKGTAKSTAVRALAELLPAQQVIADCPYGCHPTDHTQQCQHCQTRTNPPVEQRSVPLVTLPLGATRDRVVGTLSVASALDGEYEFEPGLLAEANRGLLYVDEINLLDDHLVDVLLDVAASGVNHVQREGVSVTHPASFTLVGTMNPEEGDLRPQLRDRFDLRIAVAGSDDLDQRVAIMDQALSTTTIEGSVPARPDPETATKRAQERLLTARDTLESVCIPDRLATEIADLCRRVGVDGHRGDIAIARGACALAALDGRTQVHADDIQQAAEWALAHRVQSDPFDSSSEITDDIEEQFDEDSTEDEGETDPEADDVTESSPQDESSSSDTDPTDTTDEPTSSEETFSTEDKTERESSATERQDDEDAQADDDPDVEGQPAQPRMPAGQSPEPGTGIAPSINASDESPSTDRLSTETMGTRIQERSVGEEGVRVRTEEATAEEQIDPTASVRAAAKRGATNVERQDLRQSVRETRGQALVVIAIDASASMQGPIRTVKGVVMDLLRDAYEHRDDVAVVAFGGQQAEVVLPPTDSVTRAARHLKELPVADRTPLPAGLKTTAEVLDRATPTTGVAVVLTDGRANVAEGSPTKATRQAAQTLGEVADETLVVDASEDGHGLIGEIITATEGRRINLAALSPDQIDHTVALATDSDPPA